MERMRLYGASFFFSAGRASVTDWVNRLDGMAVSLTGRDFASPSAA